MTRRVVRKSSVRPASRVGMVRNLMAKEQGDLLDAPPEKIVIGLDGSLTNYGVVAYGTESGRYVAMLFKPKYKGARRLFEIWEMVSAVANFFERNFEVCEYVLEGYSFASKSRQHAIGEGGAATKLALVMSYGGADPLAFPTIVSPNAVKKFATGKGSGEKSLIVKRVWQKWAVDIDNDNMADGMVLARIGAALVTGRTDFDYEREVIDKLERNTEWGGK